MEATLELPPVDTETSLLDPSRLIIVPHTTHLPKVDTPRVLRVVVSKPRPFYGPHDSP